MAFLVSKPVHFSSSLQLCDEPDRMRGDGHKLQDRTIHLNNSKHIFTVRVTEHWRRLPREVVESPSLEIAKKYPDVVLGIWLWLSLLEQRIWTR